MRYRTTLAATASMRPAMGIDDDAHRADALWDDASGDRPKLVDIQIADECERQSVLAPS